MLRSTLITLLATVSLSAQQATDVSELCSSLGVLHFKIFPLSSEIKNNYCKAEPHVCVAFEMFSSNDFAKEVVSIKRKLGCYPNKPSTGMEREELCNRLRALPEVSKKSLYELFSKDPKKVEAFSFMLDMMRMNAEEWLLPILEQYC